MGVLTLGLRNFTARSVHEEGQPTTLPYALNPGQTGVKGGHPLVLVSGSAGGYYVGAATKSGSYVSSSRILGLAAHPQQGALTSAYGSDGFAIPPAQGFNNMGAVGTDGLEQMQVYVCSNETVFSANLRSGVQALPGLVGTRAALFVEDSTNDIMVLDPGAPQYENWVITAINPTDVGKYGGRVSFVAVSGVSQWPDPA